MPQSRSSIQTDCEEALRDVKRMVDWLLSKEGKAASGNVRHITILDMTTKAVLAGQYHAIYATEVED